MGGGGRQGMKWWGQEDLERKLKEGGDREGEGSRGHTKLILSIGRTPPSLCAQIWKICKTCCYVKRQFNLISLKIP